MGRGERESCTSSLGHVPTSAAKHMYGHPFPNSQFPHLLMNRVAANGQDPFHFQHPSIPLSSFFQMATSFQEAMFSGTKTFFSNVTVLVKTPLASSDRKVSPNWLKESANVLVYIR